MVKELPFGQITPVAQPIGAFASPGKKNVADAARPTLLGDTQKIVRQQMMGVGSYQGYNQWQELATAIGTFSQQTAQLMPAMQGAIKATNEQIGTEEAYKAAQNFTAKSKISLQNQIELGAGNAAASVSSLEKIDPVGAELAATTNPYRLAARRKVFAQLLANEIDDILDADLANNAAFLSTVPVGGGELTRRRSSLTRQLQKKYGLTGDEPEYHKYVVGELNKAWDKYRDNHEDLYNETLEENTKLATVASLKTTITKWSQNGIQLADGTVVKPGSRMFALLGGRMLTTEIDKNLAMLAGKSRADVWKSIQKEIVPIFSDEITKSLIDEIRVGSAADDYEKRPRLGDVSPASLLDLRADGLRDEAAIYESEQKVLKKTAAILWDAPGGPGRFPPDSPEYKEALQKLKDHPELAGYRGIEEFLNDKREENQEFESYVSDEEEVDVRGDEQTFIDSLTPEKLTNLDEVYAEAKAIAKRYPRRQRMEALGRIYRAINDAKEADSKLPTGSSTRINRAVQRDLEDGDIAKLDRGNGFSRGILKGQDFNTSLGQAKGQRFVEYAESLQDGYRGAIAQKFLDWETKNPGKIPTSVQANALMKEAVNEYRASDEHKQLRNIALGLTADGKPKGEQPGTVLTSEDIKEEPKEKIEGWRFRDFKPQSADNASAFSDKAVKNFRKFPLMKAGWIYDELSNVQEGREYSPQLLELAKRAKVHPDRMLLHQLEFYDQILDPERKIKGFLQNRITNRKNNQQASASHLQGKGNWVANMIFGGPVAAATLDGNMAWSPPPPPPLENADRSYDRTWPVNTPVKTRMIDMGKALMPYFSNREDLITMIAIGMAETGGKSIKNDKALDKTDDSYGVWQINLKDFPATDKLPALLLGTTRRRDWKWMKKDSDLFDLNNNAKAARLVYDEVGGGKAGFNQWATYKHKKHLEFMDAAGKVVDQLLNKSSIGGGTMVAMHDYQKDPYLRKTILEIINTPGYDPDTVREAQRQLLRMNQGLPRFP